MGEKDAEIARLKAALAERETGKAPKTVGDNPNPIGLVILGVALALVAFVVFAVSQGGGNDRAEAIALSCQIAANGGPEEAECKRRMDAVYRGDLTVERTSNAAEQTVSDIRAGR